jgi:hypothetical protein
MPDDKKPGIDPVFVPETDTPDEMVAGALALQPDASLAQMFARGPVSPALAIMLNESLFNRVGQIARYMAAAKGIIPAHLLGCSEACFAVVLNAIVWKLNPYMVAACTYQTPGGRIGFEGKLCQAIIENSGKVRGRVRFQHYHAVDVVRDGGTERCKSIDALVDEARANGWKVTAVGGWENVQGKFGFKTSQKGNEFPVPAWDKNHERGLGVRVSAQVIGEAEPRSYDFDLVQAFPRNSTLWATDPKTQICYTAVRRFASTTMPGLMMGVPEWSDEHALPGDTARDVTGGRGLYPGDQPGIAPPEPTRVAVREHSRAPRRTQPQAEPANDPPAEDTVAGGSDAPSDDAPVYALYDEVGEEVGVFNNAEDFAAAFLGRHDALAGKPELGAFLEANSAMVDHLPEGFEAVTSCYDSDTPAPAAAVPPVQMKADGKPDVLSWQRAVQAELVKITSPEALQAYAADVMTAGTAAKIANGPLNSLKIDVARRKGEIEKAAS